MDENATFKADGASIDVEKVTSFENTEPAAAADAPTQALNVYLKDGSKVSVRGEEAVQDFIETLEEHLESEGE